MTERVIALILTASLLVFCGVANADSPKVADGPAKDAATKPSEEAISDSSRQNQGENRKPPVVDLGVIVTCQPTSLYVIQDGKERVICRIPVCTVLEFDWQRVEAGYGGSFWPVWYEFGKTSRVHGFVKPAHVFSVEEMRQRVIANLPDDTGREEFESDASIAVIPRVVLVSEVRIVKAWKEVVRLVTRNGKQPEEKRSPEPHLALAHLWVAVGSHADALEEFLKGAEMIRSQKKGDLLEYAKYFTVLEESLRRATKDPGTPYVVEGRRYWGYGMNEVREGRLDRAAFNFTDAVRLAPSEPVNWFSRALVYRALGLDEAAERDARIGVTIEQKQLKDPRSRYNIWRSGRDLETFQGAHRQWLEQMRRGDGISWERQY